MALASNYVEHREGAKTHGDLDLLAAKVGSGVTGAVCGHMSDEC